MHLASVLPNLMMPVAVVFAHAVPDAVLIVVVTVVVMSVAVIVVMMPAVIVAAVTDMLAALTMVVVTVVALEDVGLRGKGLKRVILGYWPVRRIRCEVDG